MSDRQDPKQTPDDAADLRKQAEEQAGAMEPVSLSAQSPEAIQQMIHELRVHQIELELQNEELRRAQTEIEESQARYFDLYDLAPVGYATVSEKGLILEANLTAATLLGVNRGALVKKPLTRFILKEDQDIYYLHCKKLFETGEPERCELRLVKPDGSVFWVCLDATAAADTAGIPVCRVVLSDITERKQAEEALKKIEWMLSQKQTPDHVCQAEDQDQGYGDLTALNSDGIILKFIGPDLLRSFSNDYLELLGTSSAIYEVNGDYAFGIFSSGWCRMMDKASRNLCDTPDNVEALNSGRWLCHESCWTDCAKEAILKREQVDIECNGGIRMYAVPIFANGEVVGAINFGYGDPPEDREKLQKLAATYQINYDDLVREAHAYDTRPPYVIEMAKNRLHTTARLIGSMIETKQAEEAIRISEEKHRRLFETMTQGVIYQAADGAIISANPAAERILGLSLEQMKGKTSMDPRWKMIEEDGTAFPGTEHPTMTALKTGNSVGPVTRGVYQPDKNAHVWLNITAIPLFQPGETEPFQAYATFEDITERKETERKLKESEEKFRTIFDQNILAFYLHDVAGNVIDVNHQACLQLGYSYKELLEMSVFDFIYTKESGGYLTKEEILHLWNQMDVGERTTVEDVHQRKDGTIFYVEVSTGVIHYHNRNIIMALAKDITERKQTERMIEARLNLLTFASNNPLDAVLQQTLDEVCELLNSPIGFFHFVSADGKKLTLKAWSTDTLQSFCEMGDKSGMYYSVDEAGVWVDCIHERRPVTHNDYASLPHRKGLPEDHAMVTRELVVPVMRNDRIVAILGIGNKPQDYAEQDIRVVSFFADVAWEIVEDKLAEQKLADYTQELEQLNHHLDAELDKARQVHERTLPTAFPDVEGLSFAAHYQPAQKLGGDFYDLLHKDNKLIFYLSDVSGHGLDGAMLSVFVKHTIKSYITFTPADELAPASILRHLAEQFGRENYPEDLYVCLFMAVLDLNSMELSYCGAGFQEALLLQLGSGERHKLHNKGMFITSYLPVEILKLQESSITLTPVSTIFCTTDGLTEQGSQGVYYRDRLPDAFFQNAHQPPHLVAQAVMEDFRQFNNGSLQGEDDITFLVLQVSAKL